MKIHKPTGIGLNSGFGIPTAGTSGQILAKVNSTPYNTQWIDNGVQATYIAAGVGNGQVFPTLASTVVTGWNNSVAINAAEWNASTGVFTATKAGIYLVTANLTFGNNQDTVNTEYGVSIGKNGYGEANARLFVPLNQTNSSFKQTNTVSWILSIVPGDTIQIIVFQASGADRQLHTNGNFLTIQELPSRIIR